MVGYSAFTSEIDTAAASPSTIDQVTFCSLGLTENHSYFTKLLSKTKSTFVQRVSMVFIEMVGSFLTSTLKLLVSWEQMPSITTFTTYSPCSLNVIDGAASSGFDIKTSVEGVTDQE